MNAHAYAQQYRQTAVSSAVLDASPHKLVALMLAGIRERIKLASACITRGDLARKGKAIGETNLLLGELNGSLDHSAGGDIANGLSALYDYAQQRLTEANLSNDTTILDEVDGLVADIENAWLAIDPDKR